MDKRATHKVRIRLRNGESLEIHDDLIAIAFNELRDDLSRLQTTARALLELVRASHPVIKYVAEGGPKFRPDAAPTEQASACLETIQKQLEPKGTT